MAQVRSHVANQDERFQIIESFYQFLILQNRDDALSLWRQHQFLQLWLVHGDVIVPGKSLNLHMLTQLVEMIVSLQLDDVIEYLFDHKSLLLGWYKGEPQELGTNGSSDIRVVSDIGLLDLIKHILLTPTMKTKIKLINQLVANNPRISPLISQCTFADSVFILKNLINLQIDEKDYNTIINIALIINSITNAHAIASILPLMKFVNNPVKKILEQHYSLLVSTIQQACINVSSSSHTPLIPVEPTVATHLDDWFDIPSSSNSTVTNSDFLELFSPEYLEEKDISEFDNVLKSKNITEIESRWNKPALQKWYQGQMCNFSFDFSPENRVIADDKAKQFVVDVLQTNNFSIFNKLLAKNELAFRVIGQFSPTELNWMLGVIANFKPAADLDCIKDCINAIKNATFINNVLIRLGSRNTWLTHLLKSHLQELEKNNSSSLKRPQDSDSTQSNKKQKTDSDQTSVTSSAVTMYGNNKSNSNLNNNLLSNELIDIIKNTFPSMSDLTTKGSSSETVIVKKCFDVTVEIGKKLMSFAPNLLSSIGIQMIGTQANRITHGYMMVQIVDCDKYENTVKNCKTPIIQIT